MTVKAFISGCAGTRLTPEEIDFFAAEQPWGLILFKRNCRDAGRDRANWSPISATRRPSRRAGAHRPGGRPRPAAAAARMAGLSAGAACSARIAEADAEEGARAAWLQARLIAADLADLGITVDCLPVLDVIVPGASEAIGNRSFGGDPALVTRLGQATRRRSPRRRHPAGDEAHARPWPRHRRQPLRAAGGRRRPRHARQRATSCPLPRSPTCRWR